MSRPGELHSVEHLFFGRCKMKIGGYCVDRFTRDVPQPYLKVPKPTIILSKRHHISPPITAWNWRLASERLFDRLCADVNIDQLKRFVWISFNFQHLLSILHRQCACTP